MKGARIHEFGSPDVIRIDDVRRPAPNDGEHARAERQQLQLVPQLGTVRPLADARVAHQMLAGASHGRGKIVLNVAARHDPPPGHLSQHAPGAA